MSSLCSLVSVIISIHQPLFRAYVCPLWSTLIFVDYSCESAESSLSFCRIQCTTPRRTLSLSPCRRSSKASVRRERTPPNPSGREQPTYARPAGLFPSGPGPATPVVDNPITQSPSPCCRYSLAVPAASGGPLQDGQPPRCAAVPHLRQESSLGTNVIRHRGTEKNLRRSRHAHESVGQQPPVNDSAAAILKWLVSQYARTAAANSCIAIGWRQPSGP